MEHASLTRRAVLVGAGLLIATVLNHQAAALDAPQTLQVTKTPTCGCCDDWVAFARHQGLEVEVTETDDYAGMKQTASVPESLWSCHTARIGGYVVEGHVPFAAIERLLAEQPDIAGISVPGMPAGSPGMGGGADALVPVIAWGGMAADGAPFSY